MERLNLALSVLVLILAIAAIGLYSSLYTLQTSIIGLATEQSTVSEAVIAKYLAISKSGNLSDGIDFGNITSLPATDTNATMNFNSTEQPMNWANETLYWIELSYDSNTNVDFCIRSTTFNTTGGDEIALGNYTWNDSLINNYIKPNLTYSSPLYDNNTYKKGLTNAAPGDNDTYRFWLDVPAYVNPGTYNSTVWFKGVPTGDPC
ncbi:MAG: hypothetical protein JSW41_01865 [Candidatus Aenigmatarchaeota archaeon]|nr:MAG: hypothetical protein JSW41_01865 [Candidatus Aenigmarchaeota archaeon]